MNFVINKYTFLQMPPMTSKERKAKQRAKEREKDLVGYKKKKLKG